MSRYLWQLTSLLSIIPITSALVFAQYSPQSFDLKKASDLYDARGYRTGSSSSADGRMIVSSVNGNVTYRYPVSSTTVFGYPLTVTLNYCGSVSFSTYAEWSPGGAGSPYSRWNRFSQNRPAWVLGVNGFAVQALAHASTFHCRPGSFPESRNAFDDRDFVWMIDGYDVCNRMEKIASTGNGNPSYVDVIRLLRDDGGILELANHRLPMANINESLRPDLYTGYYIVNQAGSPAYGIVDYDSTYWPEYVRRYSMMSGVPSSAFPFMPRRLRYYPGDGLEYVFREWPIPFGTGSFAGRGLDRPDRFGGLWAGPTIFYLESIASASGEVTSFERSRHFYPRERTVLRGGNIFDPVLDSTLDSSRGRALITAFRGHRITYGDGAMVIEALGRTIRIRFDTVARNGSAPAGEPMPLGTRGYLTSTTGALSTLPEAGLGSEPTYAGWVAYVTEIVDPDGRRTQFAYEPYRRRYVNFGFPHANPTDGAEQSMDLRNYRLRGVVEPTCSYELSYAYSSPLMTSLTPPSTLDTTIYYGAFPGEHPYWTSNVVSSIRRRDRAGRPLTTTTREYIYDRQAQSFVRSTEVAIDEIDGSSKTTTEYFRTRALQGGAPFSPEPRVTDNFLTVTVGSDAVVVERSYDSVIAGSNLWLPTAERTYVNGVLKSDKRLEYVTAVVRDFGGDTVLAGRYGRDVVRRIEQRRHGRHGGIITVDTISMLHVPLLDTVLVRQDSLLLKFESLERYMELRQTDMSLGSWEEAMYDPRVAVWEVTSRQHRVSLPPFHGLEARRVVADSTGAILVGTARAWSLGSGDGLVDRLYRGRPIADSVVATGGQVTLLAGRTEYSRLWEGDRPIRKTNANGASTRFYLESYASPSLRAPDGSYRPVGQLAMNDGALVDTLLPHGGYFSEMYDMPLAREDYVRRYDTAGSLRVDSLLTLSAYTFGGIPALVVEPNGGVSRFEYDRSLRLRGAWLPYDHPAPQMEALVRETRGIDLFGHTEQRTIIDTLYCTSSDSTVVPGAGFVLHRDALVAGTSVPANAPPCPCPRTVQDDKQERELAANCTAGRPFVSRSSYYGLMSVDIVDGSPLIEAENISGVWLDLSVGATSGRCVPLRIRIPRLSFERTYLLNCTSDDIASLPDSATAGGATGANDPYRMRIDLSSEIPALRALGVGESIDVVLEAPGIGTSVEFVSGIEAEDTRPRIVVTGDFPASNGGGDFTLRYEHNDSAGIASVRAKIDDQRTSSNHTTGIRTSAMQHALGADDRLQARRNDRGDSAIWRHSGMGELLSERDEDGDSTIRGYDADGRVVETLHPGGARERTSYRTGIPSDLGLADQEFYGFCSAQYDVDETGVVTATYRDAFDRVRRVVVDTSGLKLTTRLDYDLVGRIVTAVSPGGDTTSYLYDSLGRVRARSHPDLGVVSYGYDNVGNMRYSQTQEQANGRRVSFHQYDDLNRLVLVGEAEIGTKQHDDHLLNTGALAGRLSELPAATLRDGGSSAIVTANSTLWMATSLPVPVLPHDTLWSITTCSVPPDPASGADVGYAGPVLVAPVIQSLPVPRPRATVNDFEHVARYPHFPRMAISYDRLPASSGPVWSGFPTPSIWDSLSPTGRVRNLKQREAAVAWRDEADQPYHFAVISYDDRGRPEAVLRRNSGIAYEAIYFAYNALNRVVRMTVADPLNAFHVWIGYDGQGRIDSVWTRMAPGGGLARAGFAALKRPVFPSNRPATATISYAYTRDGKDASWTLPRIGGEGRYAYNPRAWIDSLVVRRQGGVLFEQSLSYDSAGRVTRDQSVHGSSLSTTNLMINDAAGRLGYWGGGNSANSTGYTYDADGNRTSATMPDPLLGTIVEKVRTGGGGVGSNRLIDTRRETLSGTLLGVTEYAHDADGAVTLRRERDASGGIVNDARYAYSYRELVTSANTQGVSSALPGEWTYRYAANGEREMKTSRIGNGTPPSSSVAWYILGSRREQLSYWAGMDAAASGCSGTPGARLMRPVEYIVPGNRGNVIATTDASGGMAYHIHDHLGSTRVTLDTVGNVLSRTDYEPFGRRIPRTGLPPRQGFTGRELDRESGLVNMGVRNYAPESGRFLSVDPAFEAFRSLAPYHYARLDPMRRTDPDGMWDIIVVASSNRSRNPIGTAYLVDRNGHVVYTFQVKLVGQHRDRMGRNGDTPFGTYDINDRQPWRSGGSRRSYGPQPRLVFEPVAGEARASGRRDMRLHGGRQERRVPDGETGRARWEPIPGLRLDQLPGTHGCIRAMDDVMRELRRRTEALEDSSPEETPGVLRVVTQQEFERSSEPVTGGDR